MSFKHESIIPNNYLPIKAFSFSAKSTDRIIIDHWHASAELLYCVEGQLNVWMDSKKITLNPGDAIFINSNTIHSSQSPCKNRVIVVQAPLPFMDSISFGKYNKEFIIEFKENLINTDLPDKLEIIVQNQDSWIESLSNMSMIYDVFYTLFSSYSVSVNYETQIKTERYLGRLAEITKYISENHRFDCSLVDVAERFGLDPSYFTRFFKKYMGMTFTEYLTILRLDTAYKLLMRTDKTIAEIALESGFSNTKSFSNSFKKQYNETPFKYKKSIIDLK